MPPTTTEYDNALSLDLAPRTTKRVMSVAGGSATHEWNAPVDGQSRHLSSATLPPDLQLRPSVQGFARPAIDPRKAAQSAEADFDGGGPVRPDDVPDWVKSDILDNACRLLQEAAEYSRMATDDSILLLNASQSKNHGFNVKLRAELDFILKAKASTSGGPLTSQQSDAATGLLDTLEEEWVDLSADDIEVDETTYEDVGPYVLLLELIGKEAHVMYPKRRTWILARLKVDQPSWKLQKRLLRALTEYATAIAAPIEMTPTTRWDGTKPIFDSMSAWASSSSQLPALSPTRLASPIAVPRSGAEDSHQTQSLVQSNSISSLGRAQAAQDLRPKDIADFWRLPEPPNFTGDFAIEYETQMPGHDMKNGFMTTSVPRLADGAIKGRRNMHTDTHTLTPNQNSMNVFERAHMYLDLEAPPAPAPLRETAEEIRITERRITEGTHTGRTKDKMWTEITRDLVIKEAIDECGYSYEETDDYFYVIEYLRYEDVLRLVEITEDIRRERRERIRKLQWEREEAERKNASMRAIIPPPLPSVVGRGGNHKQGRSMEPMTAVPAMPLSVGLLGEYSRQRQALRVRNGVELPVPQKKLTTSTKDSAAEQGPSDLEMTPSAKSTTRSTDFETYHGKPSGTKGLDAIPAETQMHAVPRTQPHMEGLDRTILTGNDLIGGQARPESPESAWIREEHFKDWTTAKVQCSSRPPLTVNASNVLLHAKVHWSKDHHLMLPLILWIYAMILTWALLPPESITGHSRILELAMSGLLVIGINFMKPVAVIVWPADSASDELKHHDFEQDANGRYEHIIKAAIDRFPVFASGFTALTVVLADLYAGYRLARKLFAPSPHAGGFVAVIAMLFTLVIQDDALNSLRSCLNPEAPLGPKMTRIRWHCACGLSMYDDYMEIRPGALRDLQHSLDHYRSNTSPHSTSVGTLTAMWTFARRAMFSSASGGQAQLPQHNNQLSPVTQPAGPISTPASVPTGPLQFLLLCVPFKRHATKLAHVPTPTPVSDIDFFRLLRHQYTSIRGRFRRIISLRILAELRFVQFEVFRKDLADVRKYDVIPPVTQKDKYTYNPMPAEFVPPIGKNQLRHLYDHPEDADDQPVCFIRVPRKLHERLVAAPAVGSSEGWGICFIEGISWPKVCGFGLVGVVLSTAFGVLWTVLKDDVQGGFGVASFMLGVLALSVGALQGALEM
ncbi:hypothetical protein LTR95_005846 [Oleoguttula sp. CCFEE 5521]